MQVFVTPKAEVSFDDIIEHLDKKWGAGLYESLSEKPSTPLNFLRTIRQLDELKKVIYEVFNYPHKPRYFIE
jgi:hypothetical protein